MIDDELEFSVEFTPNQKFVCDKTGLSWKEFDKLMEALNELRILLGDDYVERYCKIKEYSEFKERCPYAIMAAKVFIQYGVYDKVVEKLDGIKSILRQDVPKETGPKKERGEGGGTEEQAKTSGEQMVIWEWEVGKAGT